MTTSLLLSIWSKVIYKFDIRIKLIFSFVLIICHYHSPRFGYQYINQFMLVSNYLVWINLFNLVHVTIMSNTPEASDESEGETVRLHGPMTIEQFVAQFQVAKTNAPVTVCRILFLIIHWQLLVTLAERFLSICQFVAWSACRTCWVFIYLNWIYPKEKTIVLRTFLKELFQFFRRSFVNVIHDLMLTVHPQSRCKIFERNSNDLSFEVSFSPFCIKKLIEILPY